MKSDGRTRTLPSTIFAFAAVVGGATVLIAFIGQHLLLIDNEDWTLWSIGALLAFLTGLPAVILAIRDAKVLPRWQRVAEMIIGAAAFLFGVQCLIGMVFAAVGHFLSGC